MRTYGLSAEDRLAYEREREASRRLKNSTRGRQKASHNKSSLRGAIAGYLKHPPFQMNSNALI